MATRVRIGELRQRIELQARTDTRNAATGNVETTFAAVRTVWAQIVVRTGSEAAQGGAQQGVDVADVYVRRQTDVTPGWRVIHGDDIYDIRAVLDADGDRVFHLLVCERGGTDGF